MTTSPLGTPLYSGSQAAFMSDQSYYNHGGYNIHCFTTPKSVTMSSEQQATHYPANSHLSQQPLYWPATSSLQVREQEKMYERVERQLTGPPIEMERPTTRQLSLVIPSRHLMPYHCCYHGELTGEEAEARLMRNNDKYCYLVRYSIKQQDYVLSAMVRLNGYPKALHLRLHIDNDEERYEIDGSFKPFKTVDEMLSHYENNPLDRMINSIGKPCLSEEAKEILHHEQQEKQTKSHDEEQGETLRLLRATLERQEGMQALIIEQQRVFNETLAQLQREFHRQQEIIQEHFRGAPQDEPLILVEDEQRGGGRGGEDEGGIEQVQEAQDVKKKGCTIL